MFSGSIEKIDNIKIFTSIAFPAKIIVKNNKRLKVASGEPFQFVIYSCAIKAFKDITLCILPFPLIRSKNRVKILDISGYNNFFDDIEMIFPMKDMDGFNKILRKETLEKPYNIKFQSYLIPNFEALKVSNHRIKKDVIDNIAKYYSHGYGFIVLDIDIEEGMHEQLLPIAYVHELRSDHKLFIPTRYFCPKILPNSYSRYHLDGENCITDFQHSILMDDDPWLRINSKKKDIRTVYPEIKNLWDHEIYILNNPSVEEHPLLKKNGVVIHDSDLSRLSQFYAYIEMKKLPLEIILIKPKNLHKISIDNKYSYNHDFYL